jgi:CRP-like cAMP-binding protein
VKEIRRLKRGDFFGEDSFREDARMQYSLAARSEGIVCRAGHHEVCRTLRGNCEMTPSLDWILLKNQVKKRLNDVFPFSALYDEMLDQVVENSQRVEYASAVKICGLDEDTQALFIVIEGEATIQPQDAGIMVPLERWEISGTHSMLLGAPCENNISAAAIGCTTLRITHEAFFNAVGVLCSELQIKMLHKDLVITMDKVRSAGVLGQGQFGKVQRVHLEGVDIEDVPEGFALKSMSKKRIIELEQGPATKLEKEILSECCHPLIVRLITTFQDNICVHLLMRRCPVTIFLRRFETLALSTRTISFFSVHR